MHEPRGTFFSILFILKQRASWSRREPRGTLFLSPFYFFSLSTWHSFFSPLFIYFEAEAVWKSHFFSPNAAKILNKRMIKLTSISDSAISYLHWPGVSGFVGRGLCVYNVFARSSVIFIGPGLLGSLGRGLCVYNVFDSHTFLALKPKTLYIMSDWNMQYP